MTMERRRQFRTDFGRVIGGFLESGSGLIIGDLQNEVFPQLSCVAGPSRQRGLIFSRLVFCLNWIRVCFFETDLLSACLWFFDLRVFPPWISLEDRVLVIVGFDFELGLTIGAFFYYIAPLHHS